MRHGAAARRAGVRPGNLDAVALTHMDCDHASGLSDFPAGARVVAAAEEIAQSKTGDVRYRPAFWEHCDLRPPGPLHDEDAMRVSLEWVRDLRADPLCAGVFAAHDPAIAPGEYAF